MKVLSIDFDIIMQPSIELYNHLIGRPAENTINNLSNNLPLLKYLPANLNIYKKIIDYFINISNIEDIQIYFGINHDEIINFININENIELYNIDHHHDLGYRKEDLLDEIPYLKSNWVIKLFKKNKLKKYVWIKNDNSQKYIPEIEDYLKYKNINIYNINNFELKNYNFDKIFICLSPEWVPRQYNVLFDILINIIELKINKEQINKNSLLWHFS